MKDTLKHCFKSTKSKGALFQNQFQLGISTNSSVINLDYCEGGEAINVDYPGGEVL